MTEKELGKIAGAKFGLYGRNDDILCLNLDFTGQGWSTGTVVWNTDGGMLIKKILMDAKAKHVGDLVGKPVEVTFSSSSSGVLTDWRILTEVL